MRDVQGNQSKKAQQVLLENSGRENVLLYVQEPQVRRVEVREGNDLVFK